MDTDIDRRTKRGKELAERLNRETVLAQMPKLYYVADLSVDRYRVGRTDWPGDAFQCVPKDEFETFLKVYKSLSMPIYDLSNDDDETEWEKIRNG
jgi:hypothetical protein